MACHHCLIFSWFQDFRIRQNWSRKEWVLKKEKIQREVKMLSRAPLLFSVGLRLLPPARQALRFNSSGGTVSIISLIRTKFQERKCWYHEIPIKISWFKGKKNQVHLCVLHTWIAEENRIRAWDLSLDFLPLWNHRQAVIGMQTSSLPKLHSQSV